VSNFNNTESQHFDISVLKSYVGEDESLIVEVLRLVESELLSSSAFISQGLAHGSLSDLNSAGHKLYGTAVSSGMYHLSLLANELEMFVEHDVQKIKELTDSIAEEINLILKLIPKS
jgi:HPt (histidine-containing phosphotransfer) domain-containing protein